MATPLRRPGNGHPPVGGGAGGGNGHQRRRQEIEGTPPLRGALVGFGYIAASGHVPAFRQMPDVTIEAVCDVTPERLALAAQLLPGVRTYAAYEELLANEEVDFVDITTPPNVHAEIALAALARGMHVLCEKPLTVDSRQAYAMLAAARHHGRVVMPCHNYIHAPVVRAVRQVIESGRIGEVRSATLSTFRPTHARGTPEWRPDWRRDPRVGGGGILMDHGPHSCYLTFLLMGGYPTAVSTRAFTLDQSFSTEDNIELTLRFPNGIVQLHLSWTAALRRVLYTIHGSAGAVIVADDTLEVVAGGGRTTQDVRSSFDDASHTSWFAPMFAEFRQAMVRQDVNPIQAREAAFTMSLLEAAYRSAARQGREQLIDPSALGLSPESRSEAPVASA